MKIELFIDLLGGLIGEVPDSLRAATVRIENFELYLAFFFSGEDPDNYIGDIDVDAWENINRSYPSTYEGGKMNYEGGDILYERRDFPEPLPLDYGVYAFSRDTIIPRQIQRSETLHCRLAMQVDISCAQALLGRIPQHLRAVEFTLNEQNLNLYFFLNEEPSGSDRALLNEAVDQVIEDFPELNIKMVYKKRPFPERLSRINHIVFRQKKKLIFGSSIARQTTILVYTFGYALLGRRLEYLDDPLSGRAPDSLRAAAILLKDSTVYISFFFNGEFSEQDKKELNDPIQSNWVFADGPRLPFAETRFERIDFPTPLPSDVGIYVFCRDTLLPRQIQRSDTLEGTLDFQIELCCYQALLGRIPQSLRSVRFEENEGRLNLQFFLNGDPTASERALLSQAADQIIADFPDLKVDVSFENRPYPEILPQDGTYVFRRKEKPI